MESCGYKCEHLLAPALPPPSVPAPFTHSSHKNIYLVFYINHYRYTHYLNAVRLFFAEKNLTPRHVVVMGAGMGGLIQSCLDAGVPIDCITAIERNPTGAYMIRLRFPQLGQLVEGDAIDVASWKTLHARGCPQLIVLEMMGSIGCNEAQPEICAAARLHMASVWGAGASAAIFMPESLDILVGRPPVANKEFSLAHEDLESDHLLLVWRSAQTSRLTVTYPPN